MYLSKIEIQGFKSFAQKSNFQFTDGITAIIGPNGCGKSNIVDAIRWVLGEQRPSLLRLDRMENIIFNGTAKRKPLSMAEVAIHIENTKNILPSAYSELKLTRRLYRSGDSEYLINNRQVRLKDIIDLFADTGMGSDAYSVIELKMVEQILSDNAEERRRLFEEAAGIKKYKIRRKSALRKLETADQELLRLNDLLGEVRKTVNSLSRQVGKARRYHQYKNELKEKDLFLFQLKRKDYEKELIPLEEEYEQVRETRERLGKQVTQDEAKLEKLQVKAVDSEKQFREVGSRLDTSDDEIRGIQQKVQLNDQKIDSLNQNIAKTEKEILLQKNRLNKLKKQQKKIKSEKTATHDEANQKHSEYQNKANIQIEAELKLGKARENYKKFREENVSTLTEIGQKKEEYQKIAVERNNLLRQIDRHTTVKKNLNEEIKVNKDNLSKFEKDLERALTEYDKAEKKSTSLKDGVFNKENELQELDSRKRDLIGNTEKLINKKEFLANLIKNFEGFSESVQFVMAQKSKYGGLIDTLANLVDTEDEYRPALENYLAEISNFLVVDEIETARRILNDIQKNKKGRITLVPMTLLNSATNGKINLKDLGSDAVALKDVVSYDSQYKLLFDLLFNRVILVKNIEQALQGRKKYPKYNFITSDGEFVGEWGNITGGTGRQTLNLTGRKQQINFLNRKLEELKDQQGIVEEKISTTLISIKEKEKTLENLEAASKKQQDKINHLKQTINQNNYENDSLLQRVDEINQDMERLTAELEELSVLESELEPHIQEADLRQKFFQEEENRLNLEINEVDNQYREISNSVQQLQIEYLNKKSLVNELEQKTEFVVRSIKETGEQIERSINDVNDSRDNIEKIKTENEEYKKKLDTMYEKRDLIEKEKFDIENKYQSMKSLILAHEDDIKKLHRRLNQAMERLKELELRIQEFEIKQRSQKESFEERFGEELEKLLSENPVPGELSSHQIQDSINVLRQKLESLGDVNPLAIKEHEKEKERLDFLNAQQSDLLEAKTELLETISKLNKTARKLFLDTFAKINQNFKNVFNKFFEGGEAELILVDKDDPLETNIDISVKIKGKKLSTLNLMSAGEKTLTAISLLFAIYLVKPSPFCILDEVDAPLDDVNISRYTHALKEFSQNTQFILVTHNKMTMQAAQAMYGITMEEPGISKSVSVHFD